MVTISVNGLCPSGNYFDKHLCEEIKEKIAAFLHGTSHASAEVLVLDQPVAHEGYPRWSLSVVGPERDVDQVHSLLTPLHDLFDARLRMGHRPLVATPAA
ncbi:MAG TPA: hypothetical protein VJJ20_01580 [Candidatus Paceibacterota bacterium]